MIVKIEGSVINFPFQKSYCNNTSESVQRTLGTNTILKACHSMTNIILLGSISLS